MLNNAKAFLSWMRGTALPEFLLQGVKTLPDGSRCFAETLPDNGTLLRSRVQTRQLYVYAHATRTGWIDARSALDEIVEDGLAAFTRPDGSFIFSTAGDEQAQQVNAYEQAFALLAFSELYALTDDSRLRQRAEQLHDWMKTHLALEAGGYALNTDYPGLLSQNPNMHLFEAVLAWWELTGDARWETQAHQLFTLFREHLFRSDAQCLVEFFAPDWQPTHSQSAHIDPGHHHEWTWLLYEYQKISHIDTRYWRDALQQLAIHAGENPQTKAVMNEINIDRTPYRAASRLWCQTERLKADVVACLTSKDKSALKTLDNHAALLMQQYVYGEETAPYCDEITETGARITGASPASTLYHLYVACRQVEQVIQSLPADADKE